MFEVSCSVLKRKADSKIQCMTTLHVSKGEVCCVFLGPPLLQLSAVLYISKLRLINTCPFKRRSMGMNFRKKEKNKDNFSDVHQCFFLGDSLGYYSLHFHRPTKFFHHLESAGLVYSLVWKISSMVSAQHANSKTQPFAKCSSGFLASE